uniref:RRM domain-containing protein n=1 Tax=Eutreptiella gymnastica TaxID=73025 RepID=A0A7S4CNZ8_9EUGL
MESVAAATQVLNFYTTGYTEVGGRRVYLKYSRHQELTGKAAAQGNGSILLVSMSNPMYDIRTTLQITADLLYQVFAPYGTVTKIVVIQKSTGENRQQALVQFDKHETAEQAKTYLQGQNVYVGSTVYFTLDIQYSNLEDLTVRTSSSTARVFNTRGGTGQSGTSQMAGTPAQQFGGQPQLPQPQFNQQGQQPYQQGQQPNQQQLLQQQQLMQQQLMQQQLMMQQQGAQAQQQQLSQLQQMAGGQQMMTPQQMLQQQMAQQQLQQQMAPQQGQQVAGQNPQQLQQMYGMPNQQMYAQQMYQQHQQQPGGYSGQNFQSQN